MSAQRPISTNEDAGDPLFGYNAYALDPSYVSIDERSLLDRISFVANFAELIMFVDQNNQTAGNWRRLLLKDPLLLVAVIAKTDTAQYRAQYQILNPVKKGVFCKSSVKPIHSISIPLQQPAMDRLNEHNETGHSEIHRMTQALLLLRSIYQRIDEWLKFMHACNAKYALKSYVIAEVSTDIAPAYAEFRQFLRALGLYDARYSMLSEHQPLLAVTDSQWMANHFDNKRALDEPWQTVDAQFQRVFKFLDTVVDASQSEFDHLIEQNSEHPDTALLVTFLQLTSHQQLELNALSTKHLEFYYRDILHEAPISARPDTTYVRCQLKSTIAELVLPDALEFSAGVYSDKTPIVFQSTGESILNQATIVNVLATRYAHASLPDQGLRISRHLKFDAVQRNALGRVIARPAFGLPDAPHAQHGFIIASPSLLLTSGKRHLEVVFRFVHAVKHSLLSDASFYLSTEKDWLDVTKWASIKPTTQNSVRVQIEMSSGVPATAPLKPSDAQIPWPQLKVLMGPNSDLLTPPLIKSISLDTSVRSGTQLVLANDFGTLSAKARFSPFGPTVEDGASVYFGSTECFSKPLAWLELKLKWSSLPRSFADYYRAYNHYLVDQGGADVFKRTAFTATTAVLQAGAWHQVKSLSRAADYSNDTSRQESTSSTPDATLLHYTDDLVLFPTTPRQTHEDTSHSVREAREVDHTHQTHQPETGLASNASGNSMWVAYRFNGAGIDPCIELQQEKLQFSNHSISGFARLQLTGPQEGFGQALYSKVISSITLQNARSISHSPGLFAKIIKSIAGLIGKDKGKRSGKSSAAHASVNDHKIVGALPAGTRTGEQSSRRTAARPAADKVVRHTDPGQQDGQHTNMLTNSLDRFLNNPFVKKFFEAVLKNPFISALTLALKKIVNKPFVNTLINKFRSPILDAHKYRLNKKHSNERKDGQAVENNRKGSNKKKSNLKELPNPPYVPRVTGVRLDYDAHVTHDFVTMDTGDHLDVASATKTGTQQPLMYFHIDTLDTTRVIDNAESIQPSHPISLFPAVCAPGVLYLALANLNPPQPVNLLLVIMPTEQRVKPGPLCLQVKSTHGWRNLLPTRDETNGFHETGLVTVELPADIDLTTEVGEQNVGWLRLLADVASVDNLCIAYINTQVVKVRRQSSTSLPNGATPRIKAGVINAMVGKQSDIVSVKQPFASFGGMSAESNEVFRLRVSQRLRSKDRISTQTDIVISLSLAFNDIYSSTQIVDSDAPGHLTIGVVKRIQNPAAADALRPILTQTRLTTIQNYVRQRSSPSLNIGVVNMRQQPVSVNLSVIFVGSDQDRSLESQLEQQIIAYLSPWIEDSHTPRNLLAPLSRLQLITYLQDLEYVDRVCALTFDVTHTSVDGADVNQNVIVPENNRTIFVSAPHHSIVTLTDQVRAA